MGNARVAAIDGGEKDRSRRDAASSVVAETS
jgi:hypothetical protein